MFTVYNHSMYHCSDPQPPNSGGLCTRIMGLVHDENNRNPRASTLHNAPVNPVNLAVWRPPAALMTTAERQYYKLKRKSTKQETAGQKAYFVRPIRNSCCAPLWPG